MRLIILLAITTVLPLQAARAAETVTYSYDAKGRLVKVVRAGSINVGVTTDYTYDRADNRATIVVQGSSNAPPP